MQPDEPLDPATLGTELLASVVRLNRWVNHLTAWGEPLTLAQLRVLSQVEELHSARIGDLARAERCTQPTMTVQVHRLLALGLIERRQDPMDARASLISLTSHGKHTLHMARDARGTIIARLIGQLDPEDRQNLPQTVRVLSSLLAAAQHQAEADQVPTPS